jgi:hypothetical protein
VTQTVTGPPTDQGESLAFRADGSALLVGSEGLPWPLFSIPFDSAAGVIPTQ